MEIRSSSSAAVLALSDAVIIRADAVAPADTDITLDTGETYRLPMRTLAELLVDAPELRWVWKHYVVREGKTLLVAKPKVGKSTTVFGLIGALRRGDTEYCGQSVGENVGVIYCTEESNREAIRTKVMAAGLDVADPGMQVIRRVDVTETRWDRIIPELHADARLFRETGGYTDVLIIVDTLARWAGFEDENDATTARGIEALEPITADGFAVLIVHHAGWDAKRSRGSSAIVASVDVCLFLDGEPGTSSTRTLKYQGGRMDTGDTPESVSIAYDARGHISEFAHGVRQASADTWMETLEAVKAMPNVATGVTSAEVAERIDRHEDTARKHLKKLVELGHLTHTERWVEGGRHESVYKVKSTSPWALFAAELAE